MNTKYKYFLFWIKSNKGTDSIFLKEYRDTPTKDKIKEDLESWCSRMACWDNSESIISYGYRPIRAEKRKVLLERYDRVAKSKNRIVQRFKELQQKLMYD